MANIFDAATFAQTKIDNNKMGVIASANNANLGIKYDITNTRLHFILMDIYKKNPAQFVEILKRVPYKSDAGNYTGTEAFRQRIVKLINESNIDGFAERTTFGEIFSSIGDFLYKPEVTVDMSQIITPVAPKTPYGLIIGLSVIAIAVVVFLYLWLRK